jgi:hypothetical protein
MAKKLTDEQKMVLEMANEKIPEGMNWFYQEVKATKITKTQLNQISEEIKGRGICHLKDICSILDWQFPRDKDKRKKLQHFANELGITHGSGSTAQMLFDALVKAREIEVKDPMTLLMTKKEARKSRQRVRKEKANGIERKSLAPKTNEEKTAARKERARIRKEAKKLGMTTAEYKAKMGKEGKAA